MLRCLPASRLSFTKRLDPHPNARYVFIVKEHDTGFSARPFQIFMCVRRFIQSVSTGAFGSEWWVWEDSNHRPHPYQGCALTT